MDELLNLKYVDANHPIVMGHAIQRYMGHIKNNLEKKATELAFRGLIIALEFNEKNY